ncbi:MAG: prepilin peptidase [Deltaproteobacteria bacterium]|nr:prepilin peptidase [Deltaproteobacteria bacterium]
MMSEKLTLIIPFIFGSAIGSFLNVCIYRIPAGISVVTPPSSCPSCGAEIAFYDNIPVLGYILLRGRCRKCGARISARYPLVEAATGAFCAALFYIFGFSVEFFAYFAFVSALMVVTFIDLKLQIIPDVISIPGIGVGLIASYFMSSVGLVNSAAGFLLGAGFLFIIAMGYHFLTGKEGMGGGDIKLLGMIGAFLGWRGAVVTLIIGAFAGAVVGGVLMLRYGKDGKYAIPFGPFLAAGAIVHLFFGPPIVSWYIEMIAGGG